ncbi:MAG: hypothetical protein HY332_07935 [Chloroflexi bacterium]|nr:hypothetical protein [Chloroflexota bacterium]
MASAVWAAAQEEASKTARTSPTSVRRVGVRTAVAAAPVSPAAAAVTAWANAPASPRQPPPQMEDAPLVAHPRQRLAAVGLQPRRAVAGDPPHLVLVQAGHARAAEQPCPRARGRLVGRRHRRPQGARHPVDQRQHDAGGVAAQARPQPVGRQLARGRHARQLVRHRPARRRPRLVHPALHRAHAQVARLPVVGQRIEGPPPPPALLPAQQRAHQFGGAPHRTPHVQEVVEGEAVHLPRVPAPPYQPRRGLRGGDVLLLRLGAPRAAVALDPHRLASRQGPGGPRVPAVFARLRVPTGRTPPPVPRRLGGEVPQRLEKGLPPVYDVHGRCSREGSCPPRWSQRPARFVIPSRHSHQHTL